MVMRRSLRAATVIISTALVATLSACGPPALQREYVVVGSGNVSLAVNPLFAVIDFTDPNNPSEVDVTSAAGGTIVDCNGVHALAMRMGDAFGSMTSLTQQVRCALGTRTWKPSET